LETRETLCRRAAVQGVYRKSGRKSNSREGRSLRGRIVGFDSSGENATVQLAFPVAELVANLQHSLMDFAAEAGVLLAQACLDDEVRTLAGPRYVHASNRQANRWGKEEGYMAFAGRKVPLVRPRVRDAAGHEVVLERYRQLQSERGLQEDVARRMLCGVSARDYSKALDAFCDGYGVERSSVSRHWRAASAARLRELVERPLGHLDLAAIIVDGLRFQGFLFVVALGLDSGGRKHILGLWEGATENATVCKMLLGDLVARGLRVDWRYLWILDGSKALRKGVEEVFGAEVVVQRCQVHKERNILEHLPKKHHATVRMKLRAAWGMRDYTEARAALARVVEHLRTLSEGAAKSLQEAFEETLTLHRLGVSEALRRSLASTNAIESCFSVTRKGCRNVKRWRSGEMAWRWVGSVLLDVEPRFRRVKGYRDLGFLLAALGRMLEEKALDNRKEVA
jgi:transposase-like protein